MKSLCHIPYFLFYITQRPRTGSAVCWRWARHRSKAASDHHHTTRIHTFQRSHYLQLCALALLCVFWITDSSLAPQGTDLPTTERIVRSIFPLTLPFAGSPVAWESLFRGSGAREWSKVLSFCHVKRISREAFRFCIRIAQWLKLSHCQISCVNLCFVHFLIHLL